MGLCSSAPAAHEAEQQVPHSSRTIQVQRKRDEKRDAASPSSLAPGYEEGEGECDERRGDSFHTRVTTTATGHANTPKQHHEDGTRRMSPQQRDSCGSDSSAMQQGLESVSPDERRKRLALHGSSSPLPPTSSLKGSHASGMPSSASSSQLATPVLGPQGEFVPTTFGASNLAVPTHHKQGSSKRSGSSTPNHLIHTHHHQLSQHNHSHDRNHHHTHSAHHALVTLSPHPSSGSGRTHTGDQSSRSQSPLHHQHGLAHRNHNIHTASSAPNLAHLGGSHALHSSSSGGSTPPHPHQFQHGHNCTALARTTVGFHRPPSVHHGSVSMAPMSPVLESTMGEQPECSCVARSANPSPPPTTALSAAALAQHHIVHQGSERTLTRYDSQSVVSTTDVGGLTCSSPIGTPNAPGVARRVPKPHLKLSISSQQLQPHYHNEVALSSTSSTGSAGGGLLRVLEAKESNSAAGMVGLSGASSFRASTMPSALRGSAAAADASGYSSGERGPSNLHRTAGIMSESRGRALRIASDEARGSPTASPNPMPRFHSHHSGASNGSSSPAARERDFGAEPSTAGYLTRMRAGSVSATRTVSSAAGTPVPRSPAVTTDSYLAHGSTSEPRTTGSALPASPEEQLAPHLRSENSFDQSLDAVVMSEDKSQQQRTDKVQLPSYLPHSHTMPGSLCDMLQQQQLSATGVHSQVDSPHDSPRPLSVIHAKSSPALSRAPTGTLVCTRHVETGLTEDGYVHINQYIVEVSARRRALIVRREEAARERERRRAERAMRRAEAAMSVERDSPRAAVAMTAEEVEADPSEESASSEEEDEEHLELDDSDDEEDGSILGRGSYGVVKKVFNSQDGHFYAMKIMSRARLARNRRTADGDGLDAVRREVAIMKQLEHPNIVRLFEVLCDAEDDSIYLVMEHAEGGAVMQIDLDDGEVELEPGVFNVVAPPLPLELVRRYFRDVLCGLEYLHHQQVIHRDIKPENLLLSSSDPLTARVLIADFGVSTIAEPAGTINTTAGTGVFMSPEMVQSGSNHRSFVGAASDVWSAGATLYFMVYGRLPFYARSLPDIYAAIVHAPLEFPSGPEFAHVPQAVRCLLRGMLDKNPATRFTIPQIQTCSWVTNEGTWCAQLELAEMAAQGLTGADYKQRPPVCETLCPNDIRCALGASKQRPLEQMLPMPESGSVGGAGSPAASVPAPSSSVGVPDSDASSFQKLRARLVAWKKELSRKCDANKAAKARKRATLTDFKKQMAAAAKANLYAHGKAPAGSPSPPLPQDGAHNQLYDDASQPQQPITVQ